MSKRRILLSNTENTRDLGGYPIGDSRITQYGVFLRSALPTELKEKDCMLLQSMGITTIIDLRSSEELERTPCFFAEQAGFAYHNLPVVGSKEMRYGVDEIPQAYMTMLQSDVMADIFKIQANMPGGCLYHCTAGKDRTGVVSAILLMLAGVGDLDITADYVMTYAYLVKLLEIIPKNHPDFPAYILRSDPEYMQEFLRLFHQKYDEAESYLLEIGLTPSEIELLKQKIAG